MEHIYSGHCVSPRELRQWFWQTQQTEYMLTHPVTLQLVSDMTMALLMESRQASVEETQVWEKIGMNSACLTH